MKILLLSLLCMAAWAQAPLPSPTNGGGGGGGGSGCNPAGSANHVLVDDGAGGCTTADGVTIVGNLVSASNGFSSGGTPPTCTAGTAGVVCLKEGTAATGEASTAIIYSKTDHLLYTKLNNAAETAICTIASGCGSTPTTLTTGYPYWIWGNAWPGGLTSTTSSGLNVVVCWSTAWGISQSVGAIEGAEYGSVAASNHYAWALYSAGNLIQQSGTVTGANSSNAPFKATFSTPATVTANQGIDVCFTADGTGSLIMASLDSAAAGIGRAILSQASQTLIFTAANPSTGTTSLTFPATLGAKTAVGATQFPILAALQN